MRSTQIAATDIHRASKFSQANRRDRALPRSTSSCIELEDSPKQRMTPALVICPQRAAMLTCNHRQVNLKREDAAHRAGRAGCVTEIDAKGEAVIGDARHSKPLAQDDWD